MAEPDVMKRNAQISAKYASLYEKQPKLAWVGLASTVSRQAGCAMSKTQQFIDGPPWPGKGWARDGKDALAAANGSIFESIYPVTKFYGDNGLDRLKACSKVPGREAVSPDLIQALEKIDTGTPEGIRKGSDLIAALEQNDIVQNEVYAVERYKSALKWNERGLMLGKWTGAMPPEIPLSSTCGGTPLPFDGSLMEAKSRIGYYEKLMNGYEAMGQQARDRMAKDIINQLAPTMPAKKP